MAQPGADQWTTHLLFKSPSLGVQLTAEELDPLQRSLGKAQPALLLRQDPKGNLEIMGSSPRTSRGYDFINDVGSMVGTIAQHESRINDAVVASKLAKLRNNPNPQTNPVFHEGLGILETMGAELPVVEAPNSSSIAFIA